LALVDAAQAARVGEALRPVAEAYRGRLDSFTDQRYYPDPGSDGETVAAYFLVMVAMDHRLSRPGRPYEARLAGDGFYHGADLLYRLGRRMLEADPGFFRAERLERITAEELRAWLCVDGVCPPDPETRAALLRDLGRKLRLLYGGSARRLLEESGGYLHTWNPAAPGLVELLRVFEAYGDPVEKKAMLFAKFVERRGLLRVRDSWNKRVPVDNHLTRIALRLGLVKVEDTLWEKIKRQLDFTPWEDVAVRVAVREAWHLVAQRAGVDDFVLDDILWSMGRRVCIHGDPACRRCQGHLVCRDGECALRPLCPVGLRLAKPVEEHRFLETYWY